MHCRVDIFRDVLVRMRVWVPRGGLRLSLKRACSGGPSYHSLVLSCPVPPCLPLPVVTHVHVLSTHDIAEMACGWRFKSIMAPVNRASLLSPSERKKAC